MVLRTFVHTLFVPARTQARDILAAQAYLLLLRKYITSTLYYEPIS